jgi:hypothetical protein
MKHALFALALIAALPAAAQRWEPLFNGKNLDGWEIRGDCAWTVLPEGVYLGQRVHGDYAKPFAFPASQKQYEEWLYRQAWLYTKAQYGEFDLHVEYMLPKGMNSGISIRDSSRAQGAIGEPGPVKTTPAHIGYEIQIIDSDTEKYPSGSVYTFVAAKRGLQKMGEWNSLDIESRNDRIRVMLNGTMAAEYPGEPGRPKVGPIGIQLHDQFTFMLFRNIRIRPR